MVNWTGDGTMAGFDPVTRRLKADLYKFASPGTVDLNGITRLNYPLGAGLSQSSYPNNLRLTAPIHYSNADFVANPGVTGLSMGTILVRADRFPEGHKPTPKEIFDLPFSSMDWAQRANTYSFGGDFTQTFVLDLDTDQMGGFYWNTKWWVLLYPSAVKNVHATWSKTNDAPVKGANINTIARVLSFWGNRTPLKPTITSPVSGSVVLPGAEFTLRLDPNDPDETGSDHTYSQDVNGVHFQYRTAPTPDETSPEWMDLPFDWSVPYDGGELTSRDGAWHIRGSRYWNGLEATVAHKALVSNLGCSVVAGAGATDIQPGKGALPAGNWQIRGRTFDYGHPYPNAGISTSQPGPLGINLATNSLNEPAKDTYSSQNTSPWSDPVNVNVPSQVPPPVPTYPKDDLAVSGNTETVRLSWLYRNTHQPPRAQYQRTVQIRKAGDPAWSTVYNGLGSAPYVDLPLSITQVPILPTEALPDPGFEAGTTGTFVKSNSLSPNLVTNKNDPTKAHSGNRYLEVKNPAGVPRANEYMSDFALAPAEPYLDPPGVEYTDFSADGWFWLDASAAPVTVIVNCVWADADGVPIFGENPSEPYDSPYVVYFVSRQFSGPAQWRRVSDLVPDLAGEDYKYGPGGLLGADAGRLTFKRPPNAAKLAFVFEASRNPGDADDLSPMMSELRLDDLSVTATAPTLDDFEMSFTNQYEWRVSVLDTDAFASGFSNVARFWMVPGAGTGEVFPVPSETIEGATLGCGRHRVEVYRRGGTRRVGELGSMSHIDYSRVRDDMSTAQIVVSGWDEDCGNLLSKLQTWAYELVIFRDNGYSVDRVWEGPITLLTYEKDKVTIDAKDVMAYLYRRIIKQKMTDAGTGNGTTVVDRGRRVIQNVLAPDDPNVLAYLQVLSQADDAMQYRSTPAYSRTAYEEVDDMAANAGLDYTIVGRSILLWGTKHRIGTLPEMRDEHLGASPIVSEYGMSMATRYAVSDGNGVHGEATRGLDPVSGNNTDYGLVEMLSSTWASDSEEDSGTYTQAGLETVIKSFTDFSERSISDRFPPPVVVRVPDNTSLNPDVPLSIQHLVPGVVIPLRSVGTLRSVRASQKLDVVKVVEEKGKETVTVTMSPFSRDDASAEVEVEG